MRSVLGLFAFFVGFLIGCIPAFANAADSSFDFVSLPVNQVVTLYYREVSKKPYFVCDDVLKDERLVSMRASGASLDGPAFRALLSAYGYESVDQGGVAIVCKKREPSALADPEFVPFLYRAKYRDPSYLIDLLGPLVKGTFANKRSSSGALAVGGANAISAPGGAQSPVPQSGAMSSYSSDKGDDYVLFSGPPGEVVKLKSLLSQIDVPLGEVVIKAYMYEVGKTSSDASAVQLVMSALGGRLNVSTAGDIVGNILRLRTGSVDLVASALATDSRFKVVTAPFVRLMSGKTARFVSGGQQSLLGAIVTNQNGSTQQSYERIESGTILEVSPIVRSDAVDLDLFQQVSSFVTAPGAAAGQPPTLNKRELRTSLSMQDGEIVVLGGLNESKDDGTRSGLSFLPFSLSKSSAVSSSELVLILEIKRI